MLEHNAFTLSLIRHGQSTINVNPDLMGQESYTPLSDLGRQQAKLLQEYLIKSNEEFDLAYSSTYTRALDTAKIALDRDDGIILSDDLREYSAGDWTNGSRSTIITPEIKYKMNALDHSFLPPNGEALHQVERRASLWLEDNILYNKIIMQLASIKKDKGLKPLNIAIFSHGMTIKCLLHYVMGFDKAFTWRLTIDNTAISKLSFGENGWRLISINDCSHLKG